MSETSGRTFIPGVKYKSTWVATVQIEGLSEPYWESARFTKLGAWMAARRKARKYNRLDRKGYVA